MPVVKHWWNVTIIEVAKTFDALTQGRLDGDNLDIRILFLEVLANTHERAACTKARNEVSDLWAIAENLRTGGLVMRARVRIVSVLVQETPFGMLRCKFLRTTNSTIAALFAWSEDDLGSEDFQHLATLDTHRRGHEDGDGIALHLCDSCQCDSGVAR